MLAALALLSACAAQAPDVEESPVQPDTCGASRFAHLVGTRADQIERSTLPPRSRIITPDMAVTMDYSAERLNIMVGSDGIVGSMRCF